MKTLKYFAAAALCLAMVGCSKSRIQQMALAENVVRTCEPSPLEAIAGKVPATVTVTCPEGYFAPKAKMVVTPVLVYEGGEAVGPTFTYQGEKVKENNTVIPQAGATVTEKMSFDYVPGMEKSHLELRSTIIYKTKTYDVPAVKVADGVNTTYMLADQKGAYCYKPDGYEEIEHRTSEVQVNYDVNSATIKQTKANKAALKGIKANLDELNADERSTVKGTDIISYASPEGGEVLNAKLSDKRAVSAQKAWNKATKNTENASVETRSIGQDWDGFQEAVSKSNLEDKDLILRVLSMYSDPAVRESEIKNMSAVYSELKDEVFPELRRARFVTNVDYQNLTEDEIKAAAAQQMESLNEAQILRLAAITEDNATKAKLYKIAADRFNSDKAWYNLAMTDLDADKNDAAASHLAKVSDQKDADVLNAKGVIALREGKLDQAAAYFKASGTVEAKENLGTTNILKGDYAAAASQLAGTGCFNEALADVLAGKLDAASSALKCTCPKAEYLRAVIAARKGNASAVKSSLEKASANSDLKARAAKDIEFADFR